MSTTLLVILGWFAGTILNAVIANATRRDLNAIVAASLVASPVLVYLYLLAVPPPQRAPPREHTEQSGSRKPWVQPR